MVRLVRHRQTKGAETDRSNVGPPRHILTLPLAVVRLTMPPGFNPSGVEGPQSANFGGRPEDCQQSGRRSKLIETPRRVDFKPYYVVPPLDFQTPVPRFKRGQTRIRYFSRACRQWDSCISQYRIGGGSQRPGGKHVHDYHDRCCNRYRRLLRSSGTFINLNSGKRGRLGDP
jgi:hypothetical protein